ncbi:MAG: alkylphosphonate utilization protein [Rhodobacteraceae bacterium]|nr:alkylphosphonate utilization protein [Paracoccaceae bacterium]
MSIRAGRIVDTGAKALDVTGFQVLPGLVDPHVEVAAAVDDPVARLAALDVWLARAGITTAWIAQDWSLDEGPRSPEYAEAFLEGLNTYQPLTDLDLRARLMVETHMPETAAVMLAAIRRYSVDYVVFGSEIAPPGQLSQRAEAQLRVRSELHAVRLKAAAERRSEVPRHLCRLAEAFDVLGVYYASHADVSAEGRETYSMIGARIAEFPATRSAAATAHAMGDPVVLRATDICRGDGPGRASALELVAANLCTALASGNHAPSLVQAAWTLVDLGVASLPKAWALVSSGPARMLGLRDRGALIPGMRADMIIVEQGSRDISCVIARGRVVFANDSFARRLDGSAPPPHLAAE